MKTQVDFCTCLHPIAFLVFLPLRCSCLCSMGNRLTPYTVKVMPQGDFSNRMGFGRLLLKYECEMLFYACTV